MLIEISDESRDGFLAEFHNESKVILGFGQFSLLDIVLHHPQQSHYLLSEVIVEDGYFGGVFQV